MIWRSGLDADRFARAKAQSWSSCVPGGCVNWRFPEGRGMHC